MKQLTIAFILILFIGCNDCHETHYRYKYQPVDNKKIAMPDEYWRKLTGYDSIQLISFGKDTLYANFCYPNEWEFYKFKKDTVFIHDTIYTSKKKREGKILIKKHIALVPNNKGDKVLYRVEWKSLYTGFQSHGNWFEDYDLVKEWVDYGNSVDTKIIHWVGDSLIK